MFLDIEKSGTNRCKLGQGKTCNIYKDFSSGSRSETLELWGGNVGRCATILPCYSVISLCTVIQKFFLTVSTYQLPKNGVSVLATISWLCQRETLPVPGINVVSDWRTSHTSSEMCDLIWRDVMFATRNCLRSFIMIEHHHENLSCEHYQVFFFWASPYCWGILNV